MLFDTNHNSISQSRTFTNSLAHSELCHTLMSKRDGSGDKAARLETEVSQEVELETGTCISVLGLG